jgi:hypothetical protein
MDWIINEFKAIPYIIGGVTILFIGMLISDSVTGFADRLWQRKK